MSSNPVSLTSSKAQHPSEFQGNVAFLPVNKGMTIRYQKTGSGPPLLLLHTIRTQLEYFKFIAPSLSKNFTVYAIDLPGHGKNPIDPTGALDEPYFRSAVITFIERLDLKNLTLVGESIGGTLSLTVAATIPSRIREVFAVNPYDYETRYGDGIRRGSPFANFIIGSLQIPLLGAVNASLENKTVLGKIMAGGYFDPAKLPEDLLIEFDRDAHRPGYKAAARRVLSGWRSWNEAKRLYPVIKLPVTLVYGDHDWSRVEERQVTHSLLPDASLVTMRDTGHFSAVESPAQLLSAIDCTITGNVRSAEPA